MKAEIWLGLYCWPSTSTQASPLAGLHDLEGDQRHLLGDHRVVEAAADQALDRIEGLHRIGDGLPLGGLADQALAGVGEGDHGRGRPCALGILNNLGVAAFHDRDARIGRAQVDTNDFRHDCLSLPWAGRFGPKGAVPPPETMLPAGKTGSGQGLYRSYRAACNGSEARKMRNLPQPKAFHRPPVRRPAGPQGPSFRCWADGRRGRPWTPRPWPRAAGGRRSGSPGPAPGRPCRPAPSDPRPPSSPGGIRH